jgi:rubredoxin
VTLDVKNLPANDAASAVVAHYRIDQTHSNPRATWSEMGGAANPYPTALQFAKLRKSSELVRLSLSPLIPPAPPAEKMVCETCGHVYDPAVDGPVPNTPFDKLPDDWTCPVCGAPKSSYGPAGFAVDGTTQLWAHPAEVITVEVKVPTPSVGLFHICSAPPASAPLPAMVKDVQLRVTPTKDPPTVFIRWGDIDERCIATYMVEWTADNASVVAEANDGTTTWTRINNMQDTIFAAHVDVRNAQLSGCYRVIAKDYFNRTSPAGPVACMNSTRVIE